MREPLRLLSVIAILLGGLFGLKAIAFTNNAADYFSAYAAAPEPAQAEEGYPDDAEAEAEVPTEPLAPEPSRDATEAFAERIASGVRTAEEERVIYRLRERSAELDAREAELDTREALMLAMEQRVDDKIRDLNSLEEDIRVLVGELDQQEAEDMGVIVAWYAAMDAGDAAERIATLEPDTQIQIASRMSTRTFGPILAEMNAADAASLTQLMASRGDLPETLDELEARLGQGG